MPSQQEVKWSQLKVGIIVLVSVCLLSSLLFLMSSASGMDLFSKKLTLTSYFPNSGGLKIGAPVSLEGVTIGEVKRVDVLSDPKRKSMPVRVIMKVDPKFQSGLFTDSVAAFSTVGVLGDTVIDINSEKAFGPVISDHAEMKVASAASINDVIGTADQTMGDAHKAINDLDTLINEIKDGNGTVGLLIKDPGLYNNAKNTLGDLQGIANEMRSGNNSVAMLLKDHTLYDNLQQTSAQLKDITTKMNSGDGSVAVLLNDKKVAKQLKDITKNLDGLLADANAGKGPVGMMFKDKDFANHMSNTMANVDALTQGLKDGNGTLGSTVVNLNNTMTSAQDLMKAFEANPKKYLTIQMKIF